ncbi:MAG: DUF4399 domain-containing protein [Gammaproteobacteria bacterium]|nr:DUF4399 domain-containing protein [Gammaproteobacteria bacterium]
MQPTSNQTASTASSETPAPEASPALSSLISSAAPGARVFFIEPQSGAVLSSPITVKFGIENMTVAPAGTDIPNSGHHHLLINLQEMPDLSQPLPASEQVIHFGKGQTETMLELEPGQHTLQLLLGNYLHIPHEQPVMSEPIEITVE